MESLISVFLFNIKCLNVLRDELFVSLPDAVLGSSGSFRFPVDHQQPRSGVASITSSMYLTQVSI